VSKVSAADGPRLLVLSSLFPSAVQPTAGVFIRERMFRVGKHLPIVVVAPQAWFPLQGLIRRIRPHFRPMALRYEVMQGVEIHRPRFLSFPGMLKWADGMFMALSSYLTVRRLVRRHRLNMLDVHFGFPDGAAGTLLGRWLRLPVVLTLRGKEVRQARTGVRAELCRAIRHVDQLVTVSDALRDVALDLGADPGRIEVVGNGIDVDKFYPLDRAKARAALGLPVDAKVIVSVGTLIERKGFHRVIELLPRLLQRFPRLYFVVVGGSGPEGDYSANLRAQVNQLGLQEHVRFIGPRSSAELSGPLSAADLFVLASSYEGWANVLLEAMACGQPVVATDVGGNAQVVCDPALGRIVPFGDATGLAAALEEVLLLEWDRERIRAYAEANAWDTRVPRLLDLFDRTLRSHALAQAAASAVVREHRHAR